MSNPLQTAEMTAAAAIMSDKLQRNALVVNGSLICELMSGESDDNFIDRASRRLLTVNSLIWC